MKTLLLVVLGFPFAAAMAGVRQCPRVLLRANAMKESRGVAPPSVTPD